jgi:hypothetical protein
MAVVSGTAALGLSAQRRDVPQYKVDPFWPKELPNNWILGNIHGIAVDKHDHVWVLSSPRVIPPAEQGAALKPPRSACCFPAPAVIELDGARWFLVRDGENLSLLSSICPHKGGDVEYRGTGMTKSTGS